MYIASAMVLRRAPSIPCKRVSSVVDLELEVGGPIDKQQEIEGVIVEDAILQGSWQRCPDLDQST